jgi:hypothetical protein
VHDVVVLEHADDLADGVGLADVGEELVPQSLTLRGPAHEPGDVDERHGGRHRLLGREHLGEHPQPRVREVHHTDVRVDGREGVVRREDRILGQRVEERRLADVGQPDDADGESHEVESLSHPTKFSAPLRYFADPD